MCARRSVGRTSVVFPLLLIGFGVLMLLWRWLPDFYPWAVLGKFWPLGLVFIGAGMIYDRTRWTQNAAEDRPFPVGSTIGALAFILVIGFLISRDHSSFARHIHAASEGRRHETKTVLRGDAKAVKMTVEMPAGELHFEGGGDPLLLADFYHEGDWTQPSVDYTVTDGRGELSVRQEGETSVVGHSDNIWDLKVNDATPLELKIDMGAGKGDFHMAKVNLTRMELNIGAGQVNVDLTGERAKDLQATLHGGVGQAVVRLPKNIGVLATVHGGLGSIDVHGLKKEDDNYVNEAYGKSQQTLRLTVEGGIGQIKLEQE